jgi:hypothetical protein
LTEIVITACALLVVGKCGIAGWRLHVWLDKRSPQLLPTDAGAILGILVGVAIAWNLF